MPSPGEFSSVVDQDNADRLSGDSLRSSPEDSPRTNPEDSPRTSSQESLRNHGDPWQSNHLATLGLMLAQTMHDLRNPLSTMMYTVGFLRRQFDTGDPQTRDALELLVQEIEVCRDMIQNLMDISRGRRPERESVCLYQLIREASSGLARSANVEFEFLCPARNFPFQVVPVQIRRLFDNLFNNAVQAISTMTVAPHGRKIGIMITPVEDSLQVVISDTGPGIPPEMESRVFEPGFTTKNLVPGSAPDHGGIGFGLSICRQILKRHHGSIELISQQSVPEDLKDHVARFPGATFRIRFPLPSEPSDDDAGDNPPAIRTGN